MASPGDLALERAAFHEVISDLNNSYGDETNIEFLPVVWEETVLPAGPRVQGLINEKIDACDVFIMVLHKHWGQVAPDSDYSSYTEEEFHLALGRLKAAARRRIDVFVFLKKVEAADMGNPDPQLERVLDFRQELERTKTVLSRQVSTPDEFRQLVEKHLKASAEGIAQHTIVVERLPLRLELVERVAKARAERRDDSSAKDELVWLDLAHQGATAAAAGRIEDARQKFAKVVANTVNGEALFLAFDFYRRMEDEQAMEDIVKVVLAFRGPDEQSVDTAAALAHLGSIYLERGNLDQAERLQTKSLGINQRLGCLKGVADQYTRLGIIAARKSEWDLAEQMFQNSIQINKEIDRPRGLAFVHYQWAIANLLRDKPQEAETQVRKAISINRKRQARSHLAWNYRLLGDIYEHASNDLQAIKYYEKARKLFDETNSSREATTCKQFIKDLQGANG